MVDQVGDKTNEKPMGQFNGTIETMEILNLTITLSFDLAE